MDNPKPHWDIPPWLAWLIFAVLLAVWVWVLIEFDK
jgi:hypothetical protein